ncbi:MAG: thiamine pyrophosphate-binding protein, partial [Gemmatimonadota bacterium]
MSFAALQAAWAEWLLDGLVAAGVRRAVVSPGSRSTPLVLAIDRAESAGRLEATVIVDERAAGFFALGQARATNQPSLLVCTSGSAGAHYLPAFVEAAEARVPMLALTADRPPELRGRGASQTIEQPGMFGHFVRRRFEVGPAEADPRAVAGLLRTGLLAVHATRWPDP